MKKLPQFSFYKAPVQNIVPYKIIGLKETYQVITGSYLKKPTQKLRLIRDKVENRNFKASQFPYVTFSGTFTKRNETSLNEHSGLIALDFDHVENLQELKSKLLVDPLLATELLFISPNGNGIKWIVHIDVQGKYSHVDMFQALFNYIKNTYEIEIDKACKDISRATFLCFDPEAFINPKYLVL